MIMFEVFLALLCLLYIKGGLSADQDPGLAPSINTAPSSLVVPLYTLANFTCEGIGDELNWLVRIDGILTQLSNAIMQQRNITICCTQGNITITQENITICRTQIGNLSSILSVNALPINNGLNIECQIVSFPPLKQVFSNVSTLTIVGVSSVEDIQWSTKTQLLSWSPPSFYSQDIKIIYNILVNNISIINTTERSVSLTNLTSNISCTIFRVSIIAFDNLYESIKNEAIDDTGSCTINIKNYNLILNGTICTFSANLSISVDCSIQSCSYSVLGKVSSYRTNQSTEKYQPIEIKTDEIEVEVSYILTKLERCSKYNASIDVMNYLNVSKYQDSIDIATYSCIQQLNIAEEDNGSVSVQCVFVSGSTADGCHVIFTDTNNGRNRSFNIAGSDNTTKIISLPAGNYTVVAFEIINEKFIHQSCIQATFFSTNSSIDVTSYDKPTSTFSGNLTSISPTSGNPTSVPKDSQWIIPLVVVVLVAVVAVVIIIVVIIIVLLLRGCYKKNPKVSAQGHGEFIEMRPAGQHVLIDETLEESERANTLEPNINNLTSSNGAQGQGGSSKIRGQREHMHDDLEKIHKKLPSKTFYDCKVQYEPSRHQGSKKNVVSFEIRQPNYEDYNHKFYSMIQDQKGENKNIKQENL